MADPADGAGRRGRRTARRTRVETSAGGVVFRRLEDEIRYLLIRDPYENWGLPKGHIEPGETTREAALREIEEETSLTDLRIVARLPTIDWHFRDRGGRVHKFCHFFLVESPRGDPVPEEREGISACVWHALPSALDTLTYDNAREVLRLAGKYLDLDARR